MKLLEVAVAAPLYQTLTYEASESGSSLQPGLRLLVPLGQRLVTGYLLGPAQEPATVGRAIKKIHGILDDSPLFPANMVPFYRWIANYYHYPIGEVIKGGLPAGLTSQSSRSIKLTSAGAQYLPAVRKEIDLDWLKNLLDKGRLTPAATCKIWNTRHRRRLLEWSEKGWLEINEALAGSTTAAKTKTCIRPCAEEQAVFSGKLKVSEKKTLELLAGLADPADRPVPRRDITRLYSGAGKAIKGLAEKGLIEIIEQAVYRDPFGETLVAPPRPAILTDEQEKALAEIGPAITTRSYAPFLLHGVTGSGKTEIYMRAAEAALKTGRGVLVLVPEIALATQIEAAFLGRFRDNVAVLHSGLTRGERFDQWLRILRHEAKIVIGARSAIFAPLAEPGLIVVDEEHDGAYKQDDGLRYNARDLAVLRANLSGATVVLGSATPSLNSYFHAGHGKYRLLTLANRVENRPLPQVEIVDLQKIPTVSGRPPLFSPALISALRETLANKEQSLVFLNRRGYANLMICQQCGRPVQCNHCHISLTLHRNKNLLLCHYCGFAVSAATICANCQSTKLTNIGFGTERVQAELTKLFPKAVIARLDRDTTQKKADFIDILKAVHQGSIDILVGTQMIAKGHHFPNVTLVGVVWADAGLGMPDFRAGERTFQLLSQVTGRAGRGEKPGRVIIQTHQPDHYSIMAAQTHDYCDFFNLELNNRKKSGFPPFVRLINLCFEGESEAGVRFAAESLATIAKRNSKRYGVKILGPAPAVLSKLRGKYRWQMPLKGDDIKKNHAFLQNLLNNLPDQVRSKAVKMTVDVDPESMV